MENTVVLIGRLTKDIEILNTNSGKVVGKTSIAVKRGFSKDCDFINIEAWGKVAEVISQYSGKGKRIGVKGELRVDTYQTNTGENKQITKVVVNSVSLLETKSSNEEYISKQPREEQIKEEVSNAMDNMDSIFGSIDDSTANDDFNLPF